jgi:hypothetical protein
MRTTRLEDLYRLALALTCLNDRLLAENAILSGRQPTDIDEDYRFGKVAKDARRSCPSSHP